VTGAELIQRFENAEIYKTGERTRTLVIGGEISNAEPFEGGEMQPQTFRWSDVSVVSPDVYRLSKGGFGYTVYKSIGCVRVHPVKGDWDVYYEVCSKTPVALDHRQISDRLLELYKDTSQVRYSFFIGDRGFKVNNRLKETYSGTATWEHTYNVTMQGLTRTGRKIYHDGALIGNLPDPFAVGSDSTVYPVQESLNGGELTLTFESADTCVKPCDVDPTLTPAATNDGDNQLQQNTPTTNLGTQASFFSRNLTGIMIHPIIKFNFSVLPDGATIDTATLECYYFNLSGSDPVGRTIGVNRVTRTDWEELTSTWNNYKTGNAWTSPGGDYTATDKASQTVPAAFGWVTWNVLAQAQYAQTNTSEIIHMILVMEGASENKAAIFYSRNEAVEIIKRPKMIITYTVSDFNTHLGYKQIVF
jgi:hypothetical protein